MKQKVCTYCGAEIQGNMERCPVCGKRQRPVAARGGKTGANPARRWSFAVAIAALLAALTLVLCVLGGVFDFVARDAETMPGVIGQTEDNARLMLEALGLNISIKSASSEEAAGVVIDQSIPEGRALRSNQTVTLTVSNGSDAVRVPEKPVEELEVYAPKLLGQNYEEARSMAESVGLNIIKDGEQVSDEPAGTVIWQEPESGTGMRPREAIHCIVSKGPAETFTITVTCGKGGSVSPDGRVTFKRGDTARFTITPDKGYVLAELKVDGVSVGAPEEYEFPNVRADHTLYAVFRAAPEAEEKPPEDVPAEEETPDDEAPEDIPPEDQPTEEETPEPEE